MRRGFPHHSIGELSEASFFGKQRMENETYLWVAWPEIETPKLVQLPPPRNQGNSAQIRAPV